MEGKNDSSFGQTQTVDISSHGIGFISSHPHDINEMIALIERSLGKKALIRQHDFHKTDMKATWADIALAKQLLGWSPKVCLEEGIKRTAAWYLANKPWITKIKI